MVLLYPPEKLKCFTPNHAFLPPTALPSFLPPLAEPWASSCWLNFLDDVRVHVRRPCRWCFWMNEYPLPSPLLVLRDVYKSRSPGQPAEFHAILRWKSEMLRDIEKNTFKLVFRKLRSSAEDEVRIWLMYEHVCRHHVIILRGGNGKTCVFFTVWSSLELKKHQLRQWSLKVSFFLSLVIMSVLVVSNHM